MALPTFFIIGAPKAGTTSLHHYLDQHPQIQMSQVKEPRFFAGPANDIPYPPDRIDSREEYECLFDPAFNVRGESSTDYATHPRRSGAPERIKALVPDAKFIYMVRDPIARTVSHYKMRAALLGETRTLSDALGDLSDLRSPYISPSLYASQLELYLQSFPEDSVLVIDQSDLLSDRRPTLKQIFSFLSVDTHIDSPQFDTELLDGQDWRAYPSAYGSFIRRFVTPSLQWVPRNLRRSVRSSVERRLWPPLEADLDDDLRSRLRERYYPEVERLRTLTGQSFSSWSL